MSSLVLLANALSPPEPATAIAVVLGIGCIVAGCFFPGWLLTRVLPSAFPVLGAFLGSILILFHLVLALDLAGLPIDLARISLGLLAVCGGLLLASRRIRPWSISRFRPVPATTYGGWAAAVLLGVGSIVLRGWIDPLSGWDTYFRWDGIARLMLETRSLSFYPAVTAGDFSLYGWAEGIPPLIPVLHFWVYAGAGSTAPALTGLCVASVAGLLFWLVGRFATELWSRSEAGWAAAALLATSSLAGWSLAMGQETGLTSLTLTALLYFLSRYRRHGEKADLCWAAIAAATGALARDYGLVHLPIGAAILAISPQSRRGLPPFLAGAALIAAPWYLRNALITGNPLYSHDLGGLWPVNGSYLEWMQIGTRFHGFGSEAGLAGRTAVLLAVTSGPAVLAGAIGLWRRDHRDRAAMVMAIAAVTAIWIWSVHQTFGGAAYSTRVLAPALALCAVCGGWVGILPSARWRAVIAAVVVLAAADAARRAWHLPTNPYITPLSPSFADWRQRRDYAIAVRTPPVWREIVSAAAGGGVIVDHPNHLGFIRELGGRPVSLFSPLARPVFDPTQSMSEATTALRNNGIRFIVISRGSLFVDGQPFLRELPRHIQPTHVGPVDVYDLILGPFTAR